MGLFCIEVTRGGGGGGGVLILKNHKSIFIRKNKLKVDPNQKIEQWLVLLPSTSEVEMSPHSVSL